MATIDSGTDAEDLLASIHLEKYLNHFRQAGFLLARDFCHVDKTVLNRLGVTATGHRKRILKLVEHIQLICKFQSIDTELDRCNSDSAIYSVNPDGCSPTHQKSVTPFDCLSNQSTLVKRSQSERCTTIVKPIPKPRTVFNRQRVRLPSPPSQQEVKVNRRSSQGISRSVFLEGSPAEQPSSGSLDSHRNACEKRLNKTRSAPEICGLLPPVPPRISRGLPTTFRRMSGQDRQCTPSLSSFSDTSTSFQCSPFTSRSGSPPSPPCSSLEMVSNEIYSPGTPPPLWSRSLPIPPPRQKSNSSTESNR